MKPLLLQTLAIATSLNLTNATAIPLQPNTTEQCTNVHIIASRATGEQPGQGIISSLATLLSLNLTTSSSSSTTKTTSTEPLIYPAKFPYSESIPLGVSALQQRIASYTAQCPDSSIVLMGYSQGAAVTVDALCGGGGGDVGPATRGLTLEEGRNVVAVVVMGDPRFVPGTGYDAGTNKVDAGVAKRDPYVAACGLFASRMVSYCDIDDARCASGKSGAVHMSYLQRYTDSALEFILSHLKRAGAMSRA